MQANEADSDYGLFNLFDFPISYISNMKFHVKLYPIIMKHNGKKVRSRTEYIEFWGWLKRVYERTFTYHLSFRWLFRERCGPLLAKQVVSALC